MTDNVSIAIISASSAAVVSIAALIINVVWMGRTFEQLDKRLDKVETLLALIQADLRMFYKDIAQLKARAAGL